MNLKYFTRLGDLLIFYQQLLNDSNIYKAISMFYTFSDTKSFI
jgi:hypothetical protein